MLLPSFSVETHQKNAALCVDSLLDYSTFSGDGGPKKLKQALLLYSPSPDSSLPPFPGLPEQNEDGGSTYTYKYTAMLTFTSMICSICTLYYACTLHYSFGIING